jgi:hypothetical protein
MYSSQLFHILLFLSFPFSAAPLRKYERIGLESIPLFLLNGLALVDKGRAYANVVFYFLVSRGTYCP